MESFQNTPPVLFLIFRRPNSTAQVFAAIARAKPRQLFIAADGPRPDRPDDFEACRATRAIIDRVDWPCEVRTLFRDENLGCRKAVSSAIDWFFEHVKEGIILEDDCLPSPSFFTFCADLLGKYRDDKRVMMISGCNFQDGIQRGDASYYFSRVFHTWGWATWRRAWSLYDQRMSLFPGDNLDVFLKRISPDENIALSWACAFAMARTGRVNTWDYQWAYSCFLHNGLSAVPNCNLVTNIGFGADSTHTTDAKSRYSSVASHELASVSHPVNVGCNLEADLYEYRHLYPKKERMSAWYRFKRYRKARRLKIKYGHIMASSNIPILLSQP